MDNKPGVKTTEFWALLSGAVVVILAMLKIPVDEATVQGAIAAVGTLVSFVALIISYIRSRTEVKKATLNAQAAKAVAQDPNSKATLNLQQ